jgi:hypothetical protein
MDELFVLAHDLQGPLFRKETSHIGHKQRHSILFEKLPSNTLSKVIIFLQAYVFTKFF